MILKTNKYFFAVGFLFIFFSCTDKEEFLARVWVVNSIELDGVDYGTNIMRLNLFSLDKDNIGKIPVVIEFDTIPTMGEYNSIKWDYIDSNDRGDYIRIYNSQIDYFNDTFKVNIIDKGQGQVQFVGKRVKLDCVPLFQRVGIGI